MALCRLIYATPTSSERRSGADDGKRFGVESEQRF
jgi:hypothetical protein